MGTALITPGIGLIFWMSLSFLVLLFILGKFGWPVIVKMINEREELIQKSLDEAKTARKEMEDLRFSNKEMIREAMQERDEIVKDARLQSEKIIEESRVKAEEEAQRVIESAKRSIEFEKLQALTELKNQVASFSIEIVEKVLEEEIKNKDIDRKILEQRVSEFSVN